MDRPGDEQAEQWVQSLNPAYARLSVRLLWSFAHSLSISHLSILPYGAWTAAITSCPPLTARQVKLSPHLSI